MKELTVFDESALEDFKNKSIMQHNAITSGRYDFASCQLDILFMLLGSLKENEISYRISAKDIEYITGRKWNYKQLRDATESMGSRMFEVDIVEKNKKIYRQLWLFQSVDYIEGEGTFEITISEKAKPYFFQLKNTFTSFQLKSVLSCSSKYAKRLYALGCQWRSLGRQVYEIIELKKMLGLIDKKGNEQYEKISQFKTFVLDIAKEQINLNTDISFDYKLHKKGRSYKYIEIFINEKATTQLEINFDTPVEDQAYIGLLKSYGLNEDQATQTAKNMLQFDFDKLIEDLNKKARAGTIMPSKATAYLVGVLQKKGVIKK